VFAASIIALITAASTSEISVNFYQITLRNSPEDSHLHTRRRENLKSHDGRVFCVITEQAMCVNISAFEWPFPSAVNMTFQLCCQVE
jgi:hypothetical protein